MMNFKSVWAWICALVTFLIVGSVALVAVLAVADDVNAEMNATTTESTIAIAVLVVGFGVVAGGLVLLIGAAIAQRTRKRAVKLP